MIRKLHGKTQGRLRAIAERYQETKNGIPVNPEILKGLLEKELEGRIDVVFDANLDRCDGQVSTVKKNIHWKIWLKEGLAPQKQRFAYAHELAHIITEVSDPEFEYFILDKLWLRRGEFMADRIAGYLLCPWKEILDFLWLKYPNLPYEQNSSYQESSDLLKLKEMAKIFQVSFLTLYRQIWELFQGLYLKMERVDQLSYIRSNPIFNGPAFKI